MVFVLVSCIALGQVKKSVDIPVNIKGDTTSLYQWSFKLHGKLKLKDLTKTSEPFHFRFWQDGQAVDLWTTDNKTFQGLSTNYIWEYKPRHSAKPSKIFTAQYRIDTALSRQAYKLFGKDSISGIPSEEKIKGWNQGLDGTFYLMEISSSNAYAFKSYWTPTAQKDLKEAGRIEGFIENLNKVLHLSVFSQKFQSTLRGGTYSDGGIWILAIPEKENFNQDYDNDLEDDIHEMFY